MQARNDKLDISTSSGRIKAKLPDMEIVEVSSERLEAIVGGGSVPVEIETTSGDIYVGLISER